LHAARLLLRILQKGEKQIWIGCAENFKLPASIAEALLSLAVAIVTAVIRNVSE